MKHLLLIAFITCFSLSCKSSKIEEENTPLVKKPLYSEVSDNNSPGTIHFKANIINIYKEPLSLCGLQQNNMVSLQLSNIIESNSSLINIPQKGKTVFFKFLKNVSGLKSGENIEASAKELLCKNGIETYYVVTTYKKI